MPVERIMLGKMVIGFLNRDKKTYRVIRNYPHDVARKLDAYGIDSDTVTRFPEWGVETVEVEERRDGSVRLYTMTAETWTNGVSGSLGDKGLPHHFVPLDKLPKPEVLRRSLCLKPLLCHGKRCVDASGHFKAQPLHLCPECHTRTPN